ncbi:hypothetical protein OWR28_02570 [Chryseobacterium sp. 1B4]
MDVKELEGVIESKFNDLNKQVSDFQKASGEKSAEQYKELETKMSELQKQIEEGLKAADNSQELKDTLGKMQDHLDNLDMKLQRKGVMNGVVKTLDTAVKEHFDNEGIKASIETMKKINSLLLILK